MDSLFTLLAFLNGEVYIQGKELTFGECVQQKLAEIKAVSYVTNAGHDFPYTFRCVLNDNPLIQLAKKRQ